MKQDIAKSPRSIGVLLHPSSLPESPVCGTFGAPAREWLKLLAAYGVGVWQLLPLGPPDSFGSPYSSPSSFAYNCWFVDASDLIDEGFLPSSVLSDLPGFEKNNNGIVDFDLADLRSKKIGELLRKYWRDQNSKWHLEFNTWCGRQFWLKDHVFFMELRKKFDDLPWWKWPKNFEKYKSALLNFSEVISQDKFLEHSLIQWHLDRQWKSIRKLANDLGIKLIGDLPFYVSRDSADVWSNSSLFSILRSGDLLIQSGVPPDYFSENGQLWGTPVYRWQKHKSTRYRWWRSRLSRHLDQVDLLRLDHFRALSSYWAVPGNHLTAKEGYWSASPGLQILNLFQKDHGSNLPVIAEDLGVITSEVESLRDYFRLSGMKILQFAFDGNQNNPYLPENIKGNNWIVYTGTHDNETTLSWWNELDNGIKSNLFNRFYKDDLSPCWQLIKMGLSTEARLFIAPIQDLMELDNSARLNRPGTIENNWNWRLNAFDEQLKNSLETYGELGRSCKRSFEDASKLI